VLSKNIQVSKRLLQTPVTYPLIFPKDGLVSKSKKGKKKNEEKDLHLNKLITLSNNITLHQWDCRKQGNTILVVYTLYYFQNILIKT